MKGHSYYIISRIHAVNTMFILIAGWGGSGELTCRLLHCTYSALWKQVSRSSPHLSDRELISASLTAQLVKNPPVMQEILVRFLGREDPLEKG